jgi:two-component system cell cycle response regulator
MSDISGNKQRLLIVDDSKVIRVTARKILQNHFETVEAVDGNNAWDILTSQEPFTLIVSDLTMPNLDGFALLEKIRSSHLPHVRNLPVIIITGANDSEATMQRATTAGATDFIGKPFDSIHLLARTQAHASSYTANNTLTEENISLEDMALVDALTGLANDMAFTDLGSQQLAFAIRHNTSLAIASLEIDNFGELVKQHDTDAGELVIKSVGSALAANIRKEDVAARTGTARFALLLPGMDAAGISNLSDRIASDIGKHAVIIGGKRIRYTVSIGIAAPGIQPDTSFDDLLAAAGDSLKQAVARGGNQIILDDTDEPAPDAAAPATEWTLESFEKAHFGGTEWDDTLPDIEHLQVETLEPLSELHTDPAMDIGAVTADSEPEEDQPDSVFTARNDSELTPESDKDEVEETIVITSPYSLYDLDELEITDPSMEPDTASETDSEADTIPLPARDMTEPALYTSTGSATVDETGDSDIEEAHPGLFRRLLAVLCGRRA